VKTINSVAASALLFTLASCSGEPPTPTFSIVLLPAPTTRPATSPRLSSGGGDQLSLSWVEPDGDSASLRYARFIDGAWSAASTVTTSAKLFVNWADQPSVVPLGNDRLAAHWLVANGGHGHAYDIAFAESRDNGVSWTEAITPHDDGTNTEHGFVSIFPSHGAAGLIWLDGRKTVNAATDDPVASGTMLQSNSGIVDELVCDCCQTDVAIAASGPVAAYRDRSVDEIRDIRVSRMLDGHWQPGVAVASDNWRIDGCPVNGPSITADGQRIAVAWFTAAQEPLVQVAISNDSGASFSAPVEVVRGDTLGRVAVAFLDGGDLALSWLASSESSSSTVKARRVLRDGTLGPARDIASASSLSVPQMERHDSNLIFAWTESGPDSVRVASGTVHIDAL
jgi:hypothetical protein